LHPNAPDLSHVPALNPEKHNSRSREDFHRLSGAAKAGSKPMQAGVVGRIRTNGSNPAHGDAKRKHAANKCAEVFALPL
jgi:hypothetical protein